MFNPIALVIDSYVEHLKAQYLKFYGILEPDFPNMLAFVGRLALETIANSDAAYHDVFHTMHVTEVGQQLLKGKHILHGGVSPRDWMHFTIATLCHDIGYVRGIFSQDRDGQYIISLDGKNIALEHGATDAALTAYHVDRSMLFVKERFGKAELIDEGVVMTYIDRTRMPVPAEESYRETMDYAGLVRAADLIGQLSDLSYTRKCAALYAEFRETGLADKLGYRNPADVRVNYPGFFWNVISPLVREPLRLLQATQEGKGSVAGLYAHVFAEEHEMLGLGPERKSSQA